MSAIWGTIDFAHEFESETLAQKMKKPYDHYKLDIIRQYPFENGFFTYGGQYFTKEAKLEELPIAKEQDSAIFTADAVLDNRQELMQILKIEGEGQNNIPDGTLLYQMLQKEGKQSLATFLGTYAFAYYDRKREELWLVNDSVGSRSLYYYYADAKVYFSTLIKPILVALNGAVSWNQRFFCDYLALNDLTLYTECEETPYQNIYKVAPGQVVILSKDGYRKEDYWSPPSYKKAKKKSDREYQKEFVALFEQCVNSVLRSDKKTGILLSGGLDSTSVACFASRKLQNNKEKLYSYTSVPEGGYVSKEMPYYITNEKSQVEITKEFLGNLECSYLDIKGMNCFDGADKLMEQLEIPFKSLQNIRWFYEAASKAANDGCRILLTGQYGNTTISLGDFGMNFMSLLQQGKVLRLMKEIDCFHRRYQIGRKKIYSVLLQDILEIFMPKNKKEKLFEKVYANEELLKKFQANERFLSGGFNLARNKTKTMKAYRPYIYYKNALVQIGEFETHQSLVTGILFRDPTRDRRLLSYCMKLPEEQFCSFGIDRRLVRVYLSEYLPKEIVEDIHHKGLQCADTRERLLKSWNHIYQECVLLLQEEKAGEYLNLSKIRKKLQEYKNTIVEKDDFELLKLLYSILIVKYALQAEKFLQKC